MTKKTKTSSEDHITRTWSRCRIILLVAIAAALLGSIEFTLLPTHPLWLLGLALAGAIGATVSVIAMPGYGEATERNKYWVPKGHQPPHHQPDI